MLEIIFDNNILEIPKESIKYNLQFNDISDLETRQCNYTDGFSLPKSSHNTHFFKELGLVGDISDIPYQKVNVDLLENGVHLIRNGWMEVQETANEYKINIREGIIDLFKAIENKTFGDDVDLSEINHNRDVTSVINSFTNENYRYIVNDYNGKTHINPGNKINIDYLVPSVRIKYLWNKIFSTFGFNFLGDFFDSSDFDELWLTYPKATISPSEVVGDIYADFTTSSESIFASHVISFQSVIVTNGTSTGNNSYIVSEPGNYKIESQLFGVQRMGVIALYQETGYEVLINGVQAGVYFYGILSNNFVFLNAGDIVTVRLLPIGTFNDFKFSHENKTSFFKVSKINSEISFTEELKQLKITDFMKEVLNWFSLTIFMDLEGNYIFKTFDERLQSGVIDWSEKYKDRTSETYVPKNYAQRNYFKHNYNEEGENFNNGFFNISNKNLTDSKDITKSIIYSPEKDLKQFILNATQRENILVTPLWKKEVDENTGSQLVKYKDLSARFYLLRSQYVNATSTFISETTSLEQTLTTNIPIARFNTTNYKGFIPRYYNNIKILLDDFRLHKIKLNLNEIDINNIDYDKIYYFEQEQNYYLLNKLSYQSGRLSNAEFYRIKYTLSTPSNCGEITLNSVLEINTEIRSIKYNYNLNGYVFLNITFQYSIDGINWLGADEISLPDNTGEYVLSNIPEEAYLFRIKGTSINGICPIIISNELCTGSRFLISIESTPNPDSGLSITVLPIDWTDPIEDLIIGEVTFENNTFTVNQCVDESTLQIQETGDGSALARMVINWDDSINCCE